MAGWNKERMMVTTKQRLAALLCLVLFGAGCGMSEKRQDFHRAIRNGDLAKTRVMLEADPGLVVVRRYWFEEFAPLHRAAEDGHKDIAALLIAKGADVNAKDRFKRTPLDRAAWEGQRDVAELLMEHGAELDLYGACWLAMTDKIQAMLDENPKLINTTTEKPGVTRAVWKTVLKGNQGAAEVVKLLIANGANIRGSGEGRPTPLHWATSRDVAEVLIAHGADVNTRDRANRTPLHEAVIRGNKDVAEVLIAHGADINAVSDLGYRYHRTKGGTPLHLAVYFPRNAKIVELLVAKGADVNAKNNEGETPLKWAIRHRHKPFIDLLRRHGARE